MKLDFNRIREQLRVGLKRETDDKVEHFINSVINYIAAYNAGAFNGVTGYKGRPKHIKKLMKKLKECENALKSEYREADVELDRYINRGCETLGFTRQIDSTLYIARELHYIRRALELELPNINNNTGPELKKSARNSFIAVLVDEYEATFHKRAGHSDTSRFNKLMSEVILPAAHLHIEDPEDWIKEARSVKTPNTL